MKTKFRKNTLEHVIAELLARYPEDKEFTVIYHELMHDGQGWSVNTSWYAKNYASKKKLLNPHVGGGKSLNLIT